MKNTIITTTATVFMLLLLPNTLSAGVESLRGANPLDAPAKIFSAKKQQKVEGGFERSWKQQPPPIPHEIDKDRISLRENTCLKCHSKENHEKEKAPEVGESHYVDRTGKKLTNISQRRWFCNQCHVPQVDAAPLVGSTFQPLPQKK